MLASRGGCVVDVRARPDSFQARGAADADESGRGRRPGPARSSRSIQPASLGSPAQPDCLVLSLLLHDRDILAQTTHCGESPLLQTRADATARRGPKVRPMGKFLQNLRVSRKLVLIG